MSDEFVRLNREDQRRYVAQILGLSPNHPESWPDLVDDLRAIRDTKGDEEFRRRLTEVIG